MLSFLWLVGLCWFHPPHVTGSRPSCSRNKVFVASSDELLLVFVDFIPLLYYFPLSSPLLGTRFLQQPMQKAAECYFFLALKGCFSAQSGRGRCAPPARHFSSGSAAARSSCFSRRPPAPSRAAPSVHQPADQEGGGVGPMPTPSIMVIFLCGQI